MTQKQAKLSPLRRKIHQIIFQVNTPTGKLFDIVLLFIIFASVLAVMLESVKYIEKDYGQFLSVIEWVFTIIFTLEYGLRLYSVKKPLKYATSFFGVIDLLSILPSYLALIFVGSHTEYFLMIRALRLLRIFRIFKLANHIKQISIFLNALKASKAKIMVFMLFILLLTTILGSVMYLIEGGAEGSGFSSIPRSIYWAIVTLTTVGYGDISPQTALGQFVASIIMLLGYAVIAVPTGIVSVELSKAEEEYGYETCQSCGKEGHDSDAVYCKYCSEKINL